MTALTAYLAQATSATLSNSAQLYKTGGTPSTSGVKSLVGTATGYGILNGRGSAGAWAASGSLPAQAGKGFFLDDTSLENQTIAAGSWSASVHLIADQAGVPGGTLTADIIVRVSKYSTTNTAYTTIVTMTLTGQTITSTAANYALSGTGVSMDFVYGDKLFVDVFANVTVNGNANANQQINLQNLSTDTTTFTGNTNASMVSPGFNATPISIVETATGSEALIVTPLTLSSETISEFAVGTETVSAANLASQTVSEVAITIETTTVTALTLASETISEFAVGTEIVTTSGTIAVVISEFAVGTETVVVSTISIDPPTAQMDYVTLAYEKQRVLNNVVGSQLQMLATTYYGNSTNNQIVYGELDALLVDEQISALHVMKTVNDVTAFLQGYEYFANVMSDSPVVYYRLLEGSGVAVADTVRSMTGTVVGSPSMGVVGPLAVNTDTAVLFNGTTQYIQLPPAVKTSNWGALTLEAWIKPSNIVFSQTGRIIANDSPSLTNLGVMLSAVNNGVVFRIGTGSTYYNLTPAFTFVANTWYHLVGVYSGSTMYVYLNGSQIGTLAASGLIAQTTNQMYISRNPGDLINGFPGAIGQAAIYNTALSAARVLAHYNTGVAP